MNPTRYISAKKSMQPIANHPQARILSPKSTNQTTGCVKPVLMYPRFSGINPFFFIICAFLKKVDSVITN